MMREQGSAGKKRLFFLAASLLLLVPIGAGTLTRATTGADESGDSLYKYLSVFTEVLSLIQRSYVDETSMDRLFAGALEGATDALDPLATYVESGRVEDYREALQIGAAHSGISLARDAGISYVMAVAPGSPAAVAGVRQGDIVASIDGQSTREMPLWDLQIRLTARSGTARLELLRRGQAQSADVVLGAYEAEKPTVRVERGVPILRVTRIQPAIVATVDDLLARPEVTSSKRLVVDLRGVAGGESSTAYDVASRFAGGELGKLVARGETVARFTAADQPRWAGRLAVLTDAGSQGSSEILAAVLRQAAGAELVGARTFGHAGRRAAQELSDGAMLFFSDAFYAGPDGEVIDRGLEPDVVVPASRQSLGGSGEAAIDVPLQRALDLVLQEDEARKAA